MVRNQFVIEASLGRYLTQYGTTPEPTMGLRFDTEADARAWIEQWPFINRDAKVSPIEIKEEVNRFSGVQTNYDPFGYKS